MNINKVKKVIKDSVFKLEKKYIKRNCKIEIKDVIYGLCLKAVNKCGFDNVVFDLNSKDYFTKKFKGKISSSGFKNKNNYLTSDDINNINKNLLKIIYKDSTPRILAVDATRVQSYKSLHNDNLKFASKNNSYCKSILSGLYDVNNKILINYNHFIDMDEREAFKSQFKYLKKNDIILFDRGYFSESLIDCLNKKNVNYVFRMKKNSLYLTNLIEKNINEYKFSKNEVHYKVVRYKVNENEKYYYLLTTLVNESIENLKDLYYKRWSIEEHYKELKHTTSINKLECQKLENLLKSVYIHNFIYILYYYFLKCIKEDNLIKLNNCDINNKITLKSFIDRILFLILYKDRINKDILDFIKILPKTYKHKEERTFPRESKRTVSVWFFKKKKKEEIENLLNSLKPHSNF